MFMLRTAALCALASLMASTQSFSHDGNVAAVPPTGSQLVSRAEAASQAYELVAVARGGELVIYVDRLSTNEPVEDAAVQVDTPSGSEAAAAKSGEPYRLKAPWSAKPGSYGLLFTVSEAGRDDVISLTLKVSAGDGDQALSATSRSGAANSKVKIALAAIVGFAAGVGLMVWQRKQAIAVLLVAAGVLIGKSDARAHEGHDHGSSSMPLSSEREIAQRLSGGQIFVPKSTQRILAIRTVTTMSAVHRRAIELPGRVIPDPNASGFVQASVGGRLSAPPNGFPRLGARVKKGDVLAYVEPPLQAIDVSDMRQRQGELDQQISIVERRLARYETLAPNGAVARSQLEDTRSELQGLNERKGSLEKSRRAPEELLAPVDGVIAEGTPVAGQIAQSNAVIFHIVDPSRLWVEARSFDALSGIRTASASFGKELTFELSYRGAGFADRNQSIPVQFAIQNVTSGIRAGQFVTVTATTDDEKTGYAVPRASIVRSTSGQDVVYLHVAAERFEQRAVRIEPLDGDRVLIASGLSGGERIVVQGAELLDQVR